MRTVPSDRGALGVQEVIHTPDGTGKMFEAAPDPRRCGYPSPTAHILTIGMNS